MLLAHLRAAHRQASTARGVNQFPGLVSRRIFEGRTAGLGPDRLRLLASLRDPVHLGTDDFGIARPALEARRDHHRIFREHRMTIGILQIGSG